MVEQNYCVDRAGWPRGPWDEEPEDLVEWEYAGLKCVARRHHELGHWCGYVAVPPAHPMNSYLAANEYYNTDLNVHGGVTYVSNRAPNGEEIAAMWIGFDCAHAEDAYVYKQLHSLLSHGTYRTLAYVKSETNSLAEQIASRHQEELMHVELVDEEYTFILYTDDHRIHVQRYGDPWIVIDEGHEAVLALMRELSDAQEDVKRQAEAVMPGSWVGDESEF